MSDVAANGERAETFVERVETELGYDVDYAPELGDELGWFCLELILVAEDEEFTGEVDFELATTGVEPLYAEISERRRILGTIGERIISTETEETFKYEPEPEELQSLLGELRAIHADVFG
jgi:hypothetical protein